MDDKNSGIMYLIENGKCVQSFYQGELENIQSLQEVKIETKELDKDGNPISNKVKTVDNGKW